MFTLKSYITFSSDAGACCQTLPVWGQQFLLALYPVHFQTLWITHLCVLSVPWHTFCKQKQPQINTYNSYIYLMQLPKPQICWIRAGTQCLSFQVSVWKQSRLLYTYSQSQPMNEMTLVNKACSRHSDSGMQAKNITSKRAGEKMRGDWGEGLCHPSSQSPLIFSCSFTGNIFACTPRSEHLEQAMVNKVWF